MGPAVPALPARQALVVAVRTDTVVVDVDLAEVRAVEVGERNLVASVENNVDMQRDSGTSFGLLAVSEVGMGMP